MIAVISHIENVKVHTGRQAETKREEEKKGNRIVEAIFFLSFD